MQLFRTIATIILVLVVPLSGAYAGTWGAAPVIEAHETTAPETLPGFDLVDLRIEAVPIALSVDGVCHASTHGAPCHPEHLLPTVAEPCSRDFAREHHRVDRRQIRAGLIPTAIYHPPRSC